MKNIILFLSISIFTTLSVKGQETTDLLFHLPDKNPACTLFIITGSDWCPNCKRFDKNVLSDSSFARSMKDNGISIKIIDFPQRKKLPPDIQKYNREIADKYNFNGVYPTFIITGNNSRKYRPVYYRNQDCSAFIRLLLDEKVKLDE